MRGSCCCGWRVGVACVACVLSGACVCVCVVCVQERGVWSAWCVMLRVCAADVASVCHAWRVWRVWSACEVCMCVEMEYVVWSL